MDDDNLLSGDGTAADFLNSTGADAIYEDNQSVGDALDNGTVTSTGTSTTVSTPSWQNTLTSLFTVANAGVSTVQPLLGSTTGGTPTTATKTATTATTSSSSSTTIWIILAVAAAVAAFLFLKKR